MPTGFQDFLRQRAEESGVRERNRVRGDWLRAADPEGLLEAVPYDVERVEGRRAPGLRSPCRRPAGRFGGVGVFTRT